MRMVGSRVRNERSGLKEGDVVLCPVFSIGRTMKSISGEVLIHELVKVNGRWFLKYRVIGDEVRLGFRGMLMRFRFFCTALSMSTFGQFWVGDELLDEKLQVIWKEKKAIQLVIDREIPRSGPLRLEVREFHWAENVVYWIATRYPRVFMYHHIGLFLLRSNFATENLYADVLLNFFKIVEIVTFVRTGKKPKLGVILEDYMKLKSKYVVMGDIEESEIREFYTIRGRDAAHDWDKVMGVSRGKALECKLWAEALVMVDMKEGIEGREVIETIEVVESAEGAVAKRKEVE